MKRINFKHPCTGKFAALALALALALASQPLLSEESTVSHEIVVERGGGKVDQVVVFGDHLVIRDQQPLKKELQHVGIYTKSGQLVKELGSVGRAVGQFQSPSGVAIANEEILVLDLIGRVTRFSGKGSLMGSWLLQKPSYRPRSMVYSRDSNRLWITGCVPIKHYLNEGCHLAHAYAVSSLEHVQSGIQTPSIAVEKDWFPIENYQLASLPDGVLAFADSPLLKVFVYNDELELLSQWRVEESVELFDEVVSGAMSWEVAEELRRSIYYVDRLESVGGLVAISVRQPGGRSYSLELRDTTGKLHSKLPASADRLVGADGNALIFATPVETGVKLSFRDVGRTSDL